MVVRRGLLGPSGLVVETEIQAIQALKTKILMLEITGS